MADLKKKLIVVGDRILVRPEHGEERTGAGLYLPQTAVSARQAQGGWVVSVGPGVPIPEPLDLDEDHFDEHQEPRYLPMQAQEGDYAVFLKKAAIEITFEKKQYLIVPNAAILVLIRQEWDPSSGSDDSWQFGT
jgi:chaperonin GroES